MKHISLDGQSEQVRDFVLSLEVEPDGSIIELDGRPIVRVARVKREIDESKLRAGILARREESRQLNEQWDTIDHQMWDRNNPAQE